jgi:Cu/Ag efflux pump CusA
VVFGLATSTVVTLFALPAAYLWIEGRKSPADRDNNTIQTGGE